MLIGCGVGVGVAVAVEVAAGTVRLGVGDGGVFWTNGLAGRGVGCPAGVV
jgi:hypothetical protein